MLTIHCQWFIKFLHVRHLPQNSPLCLYGIYYILPTKRTYLCRNQHTCKWLLSVLPVTLYAFRFFERLVFESNSIPSPLLFADKNLPTFFSLALFGFPVAFDHTSLCLNAISFQIQCAAGGICRNVRTQIQKKGI